ncbi:MAG TPA: hypothetical protein VE032_02650 [Actinomycetota bacterium]|nr:hypothetical protein [Actinomycetota bacterium]
MRRVFVICMTMAGLLLAAPVAQAGGSTIVVTEDGGGGPPASDPDWAPPGSAVTMRGTFSNGSQPPPSEGPWFAYLDRDGRRDVLLARVTVMRLDGSRYRARVTFTVPAVARGVYGVAVCDLGCHHGTGDLVGGGLTVASTASEARLVSTLHRVRLRLASLRHAAREGRADRRQLEEAIAARDAARASLDAARASNDRLTSQRDVALDGREAAEAEVRATDLEARNWRVAAYLLALITAVTWIVAAVRRHDTVRIRIPDTIEEIDPADDRADR